MAARSGFNLATSVGLPIKKPQHDHNAAEEENCWSWAVSLLSKASVWLVCSLLLILALNALLLPQSPHHHSQFLPRRWSAWVYKSFGHHGGGFDNAADPLPARGSLRKHPSCDYGSGPGTWVSSPNMNSSAPLNGRASTGVWHLLWSADLAQHPYGTRWQSLDPRCPLHNYVQEVLQLRRRAPPEAEEAVRIMILGDSMDYHMVEWLAWTLEALHGNAHGPTAGLTPADVLSTTQTAVAAAAKAAADASKLLLGVARPGAGGAPFPDLPSTPAQLQGFLSKVVEPLDVARWSQDRGSGVGSSSAASSTSSGSGVGDGANSSSTNSSRRGSGGAGRRRSPSVLISADGTASSSSSSSAGLDGTLRMQNRHNLVDAIDTSWCISTAGVNIVQTYLHGFLSMNHTIEQIAKAVGLHVLKTQGSSRTPHPPDMIILNSNFWHLKWHYEHHDGPHWSPGYDVLPPALLEQYMTNLTWLARAARTLYPQALLAYHTVAGVGHDPVSGRGNPWSFKMFAAQLNAAGRAVARAEGLVLLDWEKMAAGLTAPQLVYDGVHPRDWFTFEALNVILNVLAQHQRRLMEAGHGEQDLTDYSEHGQDQPDGYDPQPRTRLRWRRSVLLRQL